MRKLGFLGAFIVDDNFIGNKKAAKALLRAIVAWQKQHGYPLRLNTEASINLADDSELLELLYEANFRAVFIGIETPVPESLREAQKYQNTHGDLAEKIRIVQRSGMEVMGGMILGFDHDDETIFDAQIAFTLKAYRGVDWEVLQKQERPSYGNANHEAETAEEEE